MANNSDIIKIGFDYRSSLEAFEKETNGVFDGISEKAGKQKIVIQLDAKNDKIIEKIKELQKLKLDKFTFEFGDSGIKEQLKTFEQLENKINEIINLSKGIGAVASPIVDVGNATKQIDKLESKISELTSKYEELQKKTSIVSYGSISGKDINLVDNNEFKRLSESFEKIKSEVDNLRTHMSLLDDYTVDSDSFLKLETQVDGLSVKIDGLIDKYVELSNVQKNIGTDKSNISSATNSSSTSFDEEKAKLKEIGESAEETKKKLGDVVFKPNTEGFDEIVNKLQIAKDKIDEISKITKSSVWSDSQGKYLESYNIRYKNGSSEIRGESSNKNGSNVLRSSEVAYDAKAAEQEAKAIQKKWEDNVKAIQKYMDAVTELNNLKAQDKETGKRAEEISDQVKKVGELKEVAEKARIALSSMVNPHDTPIDTWNKWLSVMEQFEQASNGSTKSVAKLKDALRNMNQSKIDSVSSDINSFQNKVDDYEKRKNQSAEYTSQVEKLKNAISELRAEQANLSATEGINDNQQKRIDNLTNSCKDYISALQHMSAAEKGSSESSRMKQYDKIAEYMKRNTKMSKEFRAELEALQRMLKSGDASVNVEAINTQFIEIKDRIRAAKQEGQSFIDIFKTKVIYGFASQLVMYYLSFYDFIRYARNAANAVIDLNTKIIELTKVSDASFSQIYDDFNSYAKIAKDVGGTISDTINATADWARNGYNIPDSKELAEVALIYKNIGDGIDIDSANESLVSTIRGFKLEAEDAIHVIDVFNEVSNNEAISSAGIGEALKRSAASFNAANTSLEKSVALITATNSVLQDEEKTGNMWRTVSARIRGAKAELEEMGEDTDGMVESTSKLQGLIKGMTGFDILEEDGKTYKDIYDIVLNIAKAWDKLSDIDQAALLEALAGKQQSNALAAALSNVDILEKSYNEAMNSEGSAMREQEKWQEGLQYSIDRTKASLEELANDLLSSNFLKGAIDLGNKFINILDIIVQKAGLLGTIGIGAGLFAGVKNAGKCA